MDVLQIPKLKTCTFLKRPCGWHFGNSQSSAHSVTIAPPSSEPPVTGSATLTAS